MRLSASQVQTFIDCQRKWAFRYIEEIEDVPSPAAELGRQVHAELQKYLTGGQIDFTTEVGYIAASGLEHLPKPGSAELHVEEEFHFFGPSGHSYLGYKDLEVPGVVYDHKTTSDLRWQKTPEQLKTDIQATLYAVDYFRKYPDQPDVELRWVYYQTKNTKKSAVTRLRMTQTEAWNGLLQIELVAEQMHQASTKRALELPPSINHCSAYGGCPHQGRCNLSPFEKMRSHVEQSKLAQFKTTKNGAATPPAATPAAAPVGPVPSAAFGPGGAFAGTAAAAQVAAAVAVVAPAPAAAPPAAAPAAGSNTLLARMRAGGAPAATPVAAPAPAAINPPEYQPPPAPAAPAVDATATMSAAEAGQQLSDLLANPGLVQNLPPAAAATTEARGRGRPQKAVVPPTGVTTKIKTLFLNCGPVGATVMDAMHFIILAKKRIAAEGLADYRFADFGKGPGMLAVAAAAELDALEGVVSAMRLDTNTPEGAIIAVDFQARAGLVVR